jgi:hypothetical protein
METPRRPRVQQRFQTLLWVCGGERLDSWLTAAK